MEEKENKTIIFVETKKRCDDLTRRMRRDGYTQHNTTHKPNYDLNSVIRLTVVVTESG